MSEIESPNSKNDEEAHRLKDQFVLECFLLVGGAVIAVPTLFIDRKANCILLSIQIISYVALIIVLVRLSRAAYSSYKYLFSLGSSDASSDSRRDAFKDRENHYRKLRHVDPKWFVLALIAGISIAAMKVLSLLLQ
jgi:hypothetical protein